MFNVTSPIWVWNAVGGGVSWRTIDRDIYGNLLTTLFPSNTLGYLCKIWTQGAAGEWGVRQPGSSDSLINFGLNTSFHVACDPAHLSFEFFPSSAITTYQILITAYITPGGVTLFQDAVDMTPATPNSWEAVDLSSLCPGAIGMLCQVIDKSSGWTWGLRKHGSTDNRVNVMYGYGHTFPIIGCDGAQKIDSYSGKFNGLGQALLKIKGYITSGGHFHTNAINITPAIPGVYTDFDASRPEGKAQSAIVEIYATTSDKSAARRKGDGEDWYRGALGVYYLPGVDDSGVAQIKLESLDNMSAWLQGTLFGASPGSGKNIADDLVKAAFI